MLVETEPLDDQPLEMPQQEIGEIERADLGFRERREHRARREELIAVRARNALDALFGKHRIEQSAGAAIGIGHEDRAVMSARGVDEGTHGGGNALRPIVQIGGQTAHVHLLPGIRPLERGDLVRQGAARDDQQALAVLRHG